MKDKYDVVVIGAGIGGLSAAALTAMNGKSVLVVDQRPSPGGVCHSFEREGYTFDVGPHLLSGCGPNGVVTKHLTDLGVIDSVEFLDINPLANLRLPDFNVEVPPDTNGFIENLSKLFPETRSGVEMLFREMQQTYEEMGDLPSTFSLWEFLKVPVTHPVFMKYPSQTYDTMAEDFVRDEKVNAAISGLWSYFGIPPSKMSALFWAAVMMGYLNDGGHIARGGSGKLGEAYVKGLNKHGGEFLPNHQVEEIIVENGEAVGVRLKSVQGRWDEVGKHIGNEKNEDTFSVRADAVVSNADALTTFEGMLPSGSVSEKFINKLKSHEETPSLLKISLGVKMELPDDMRYHDTVIYDSYNMDEVFQKMKETVPDAPVDITIPSLTDSSLAPEGGHVIHLWNYAPYMDGDSWDSIANDAADKMIKSTEKYLPGLSDSIEVKLIMTPASIQRYALTKNGAPYGWTFSPGQMGINRLQPRTPIKNLLLAGHWTTPGAGIAGVAMSGENTATILLNETNKRYFWRKSA